MCFSTKKLVLKQAKRNKVFYKVLEHHNGNIYTPYVGMSIVLNETYESSSSLIIFGSMCAGLGEGVFHLFKNKKSAKRCIKTFSVPSCVKRSSVPKDINRFIVKAIVPKGAFYAVDHDEVITNKVLYKRM